MMPIMRNRVLAVIFLAGCGALLATMAVVSCQTGPGGFNPNDLSATADLIGVVGRPLPPPCGIVPCRVPSPDLSLPRDLSSVAANGPDMRLIGCYGAPCTSNNSCCTDPVSAIPAGGTTPVPVCILSGCAMSSSTSFGCSSGQTRTCTYNGLTWNCTSCTNPSPDLAQPADLASAQLWPGDSCTSAGQCIAYTPPDAHGTHITASCVGVCCSEWVTIADCPVGKSCTCHTCDLSSFPICEVQP